MGSRTTQVQCPRCNQTVNWGPEASFKPFCSERCKLIDLGKWASDEHAIPGDPVALEPNEDDSFIL